MEEKQILNDAADTLTSKPITIEVDIIHKTWIDKLLIKLKRRSNKRTFEMHPVNLGSLIKISKELIDIDMKLFDGNNLLESNYILIEKYAEKMARIIAIAVVNKKDDPPNSLIQFFLNNLTANELFKIASIVLQQMQLADFMHTIISIKGTNVLQMTSASVTSANESGVSL